jgi:hypothetical protein
MPTRPHHEIYQENMIQVKHGFPHFCADPNGNPTLDESAGYRQIKIGDLGYFQ